MRAIYWRWPTNYSAVVMRTGVFAAVETPVLI